MGKDEGFSDPVVSLVEDQELLVLGKQDGCNFIPML
jgi:hypothetical protein